MSNAARVAASFVLISMLTVLSGPAAWAANDPAALTPPRPGPADDRVLMCITSALASEADRYGAVPPFKPACLPDLLVDTLTVKQAADTTAATYQKVTVNFTIKNQGGTPAGPFVAQIGFGAAKRNVGAITLKPGETYSGSATALGPHGTIQVASIVLDPNNIVVESNKANNTRVLEVAVR